LKEKLKGKFIVLDGPDGCGKSTQAELLVGWLNDNGVKTSRFRDPGDTAIGEKIRDITDILIYSSRIDIFDRGHRWKNSWLLKDWMAVESQPRLIC